jgi:hypothetical protein
MSLFAAYRDVVFEELRNSSEQTMDIDMLAFSRAAANQGRHPQQAEDTHHVIE